MARTDYASVADYLATQPPHARKVLERVRRVLGRALPHAVEVISYQIPALSVDGVAVIYFAGWKEHYAVYPVGERVQAALAAEIAPYRASKGTLRFPLDMAVPSALLTQVARLRAEEVADIVAARRAHRAAQRLRAAGPERTPKTKTKTKTKSRVASKTKSTPTVATAPKKTKSAPQTATKAQARPAKATEAHAPRTRRTTPSKDARTISAVSVRAPRTTRSVAAPSEAKAETKSKAKAKS